MVRNQIAINPEMQTRITKYENIWRDEVIWMKTMKYIEDLRNHFIKISQIQEQAIREYWSKNIGNEFTEQDVWEQTRKVISNA